MAKHYKHSMNQWEWMEQAITACHPKEPQKNQILMKSEDEGEPDDRNLFGKKGANLFIRLRKRYIGKILSGGKCMICKSKLICNSTDCAHINQDGCSDLSATTEKNQV